MIKIRKGIVTKKLPGFLGDDWERIAIVGTQNSGKSIFLTSLLCQLATQTKMDGMDFDIKHWKDDFEIKDFKKFPFEQIRAELKENRSWPAKTSDCYSYRCEFRTSNGKKDSRKRKLEILDFPGERVADVGMYKRSYASWSEQVLEHMGASVGVMRELADDFLSLLELEKSDNQKLLTSYKVFLAKSYVECYNQQISPSTFILDPLGKKPTARMKPEEWALERFTGLDTDSEFVPLPHDMKGTDFYKRCKIRYKQYQKSVVNPLYEWLFNAEQMYILVDILGILEAGIEQYNGLSSIYSKLLDLCATHKDNKWNSFGGFGLLKLARLSKVGLIVPKCDLVGTEEDVDNMKALVNDMLQKDLSNLGGNLTYDIFACAAISSASKLGHEQSVVSTAESSKILGRPVFNSTGEVIPSDKSEESWITVSRVPTPSKLSETLKDGRIQFPEVYPVVPDIKNKPPKQKNLGHILNFMLHGKRTGGRS